MRYNIKEITIKRDNNSYLVSAKYVPTKLFKAFKVKGFEQTIRIVEDENGYRLMHVNGSALVLEEGYRNILIQELVEYKRMGIKNTYQRFNI